MSAAVDADRTARLLRRAEEAVIREWTRPAFEKLGSRIQRALLAEAVLDLAAL